MTASVVDGVAVTVVVCVASMHVQSWPTKALAEERTPLHIETWALPAIVVFEAVLLVFEMLLPVFEMLLPVFEVLLLVFEVLLVFAVWTPLRW